MPKLALNVSGTIFLIVALLHAWRFVMKVPVAFGETQIPLFASEVGALVSFFLALWMFTAAQK